MEWEVISCVHSFACSRVEGELLDDIDLVFHFLVVALLPPDPPPHCTMTPLAQAASAQTLMLTTRRRSRSNSRISSPNLFGPGAQLPLELHIPATTSRSLHGLEHEYPVSCVYIDELSGGSLMSPRRLTVFLCKPPACGPSSTVFTLLHMPLHPTQER